MAKVNGNELVLILDGNPVVCETQSGISFDAVATELRCKGSGNFPAYLEGTGITGSLSFTGYYDDLSANQSGFDIAKKLVNGALVPFVWGGKVVGDEIISGNLKLTNVSLDSSVDAGVTFSGSGSISGDPTFGVVVTP